MFTVETVFLTNIVNEAYTGFYTLKMVSGKKTEISVEIDFRLFAFIYKSNLMLLVILFAVLKIIFSSCMFALKS